MFLGKAFLNYPMHKVLEMDIPTEICKAYPSFFEGDKYLQMMLCLLFTGQVLVTAMSPCGLASTITRDGCLTTFPDGYQQSRDVSVLQNHDNMLLAGKQQV